MLEKLNIGKKIKEKRISMKLTQKDVCEDYMTRNMLSLIESGNATPSIETLIFLSKKLDIPLSFLLSEDETMFLYEKNDKIRYIRDLWKRKNYEHCMKIIDSLSDTDDELDYIYAMAAFYHGKKMLHNGSLFSASKFLQIALEKANSTVYNTDEVKATAPMYLAVAQNIQSPLLEFDFSAYEAIHSSSFDYEFYKYITLDFGYKFENQIYAKHFEAKQLIKKYAYFDAIDILCEIENQKNRYYNAPLLFGVYSDLETAYRQIGDFEKAYRYSTKRMSLINGFKT